MHTEDSLLLDCPKCSIMISVPLAACLDGREFPCPICAVTVSFKFEAAELEQIVEEAKKKQAKELKRSFRLTFGDV